ncbi:hypothetical protein Tco_1310323 [Tanacetum coccineum]
MAPKKRTTRLNPDTTPAATAATTTIAPPSPDYVPGPEEPEQAPPLPDLVLEPVYPEFIPPEDEVFPAKEQPLPAAASPTADLPRYVPESDSEEDPEEDPTIAITTLPLAPLFPGHHHYLRCPHHHVTVSPPPPASLTLYPWDIECYDSARAKAPHRLLSTSPHRHISYSTFITRADTDISTAQRGRHHPLDPNRYYFISTICIYLCCHGAGKPEFALRPRKGYVLLLVLGTRSERARLPPLLDLLEDEMLVDMPGAPSTDDTELGGRMTEFATRVRQDIERSMDWYAHARTALLMEREARMSREAWGRSMDASDLARTEVMSLRTTVLAVLVATIRSLQRDFEWLSAAYAITSSRSFTCLLSLYWSSSALKKESVGQSSCTQYMASAEMLDNLLGVLRFRGESTCPHALYSTTMCTMPQYHSWLAVRDTEREKNRRYVRRRESRRIPHEIECAGTPLNRLLLIVVVYLSSKAAEGLVDQSTTVALSRDKHPDGRGRLPALYRSLSSSAQQIRV